MAHGKATPTQVPFLDVGATYRELQGELDAAWHRVMASGRYILGPEVEAFERSFASSVGARHCIGVGNGLEALTLVLRAWGLKAGDEVLVPSNTFIATWLAVSAVGATPVPVEPDVGTHNVTAEGFRRALTPATKALLPVHLYGQPADVHPIRELARTRGLHVLEDAAQAHGSRYRGAPVGRGAEAAAWSFYPGKNLGAYGDAGAVTTDDDALADQLRLLRNYGSRQRYQHEVAGTNSRLDELQAALLGVRLAHLDSWNARRRTIAQRYLDGLAGVAGLGLPLVPEWCEPAWHLFVVRSGRRDRLRSALADAGVETLIHYPTPPHLQPPYRSVHRPPLRIAEELANSVLSLPMGPHVTAAQADVVVDALRRVAG